MKRYLLYRVLGMIPTLLTLIVLTFFLLRLAPGGPFDGERAFPAEVMASIQAQYGLDLPLSLQFQKWIVALVQGDLGTSFVYLGTPITEIIGQALPVSIQLGLLSLFLSLAIGIPLGVLAAWKQNTWIDWTAMMVAVSGVSLPSYLVASLLILFFSITLGLLPPALWDGPSSMILPVVTLALRPLALIARMTRASMLETLGSDFIRTAISKGLEPRAVLFKHALKNSLIPIVTLLGPLVAALLTGSFLVENVFQIPGIGKHFVSGVVNRDYPLVMAVTLLFGSLLLFSNFIVDLLYGWIDPRIRLRSGGRS
jgi:oligopeptide transport system permease protein